MSTPQETTKNVRVPSQGNYKGYYKKRINISGRFSTFSKAWFLGQTCLDVGCNEGKITLAIAELFLPKMIIGIDTDFTLIECAQCCVKRLLYAEKNATATSNDSAIEKKSCVTAFVPRSISSQKPRISSKVESITYPHNVQFVKKDVFDLSSSISTGGKYDTITCFSVTKWVHLNGGDKKILEMFCKLFQLVKIGGRVILEYQPWSSYINNKSVTDTIKSVFPTIKIRPEDFERILVSEIGFEIEGRLGASLENAKGFDRPILVLKRPAKTVLEKNDASEKVICSNSVTTYTTDDTKDATTNLITGNLCQNRYMEANSIVDNVTSHTTDKKRSVNDFNIVGVKRKKLS